VLLWVIFKFCWELDLPALLKNLDIMAVGSNSAVLIEYSSFST
jgi:hypothetical protein